MKKLSIDRIGKRGSIAMLVAGVLCLLFGIFLQIRTNDLPFDAMEADSVISGFKAPDDSKVETTTTLVTFTAEDGRVMRNVPLGQYEGSWKIGDTIRICYTKDDPEHIWTRTMQFRGVFYILFSASFLMVGIYKLFQFTSARGKHESDMDESGKEKFKISSFIIPLAAGIPLTVNGILYLVMEGSLLGLIVVVLGGAAILTAVFSFIDFIHFKRNSPKKSDTSLQEQTQ